MQLSNKVYDILKPVALYVLPALATLYGTLAPVWNLPAGEQVVGTIMVLDALLGGLLGVSKTQYQARMKAVIGFAYANQPSLPDVDPNMPKWYMSKDVYDSLLWVAQVLFPALSAAYFGLAAVWKLPFAEQIVASIAALDTFLGVILAISTSELKKALAAQSTPKEN